MSDKTTLLNPGIEDEVFRDSTADFISRIPDVLEEREEDVAIALDELCERFPDAVADAMRRSGHRVHITE